MDIYLDDYAYSKRLKRQLEAAGHQVHTPFDAGLPGQPDDVHLRYAAEHGLVLLTYNADDFLNLHERYPDHAGVLKVYLPAQSHRSFDRLRTDLGGVRQDFRALNALGTRAVSKTIPDDIERRVWYTQRR